MLAVISTGCGSFNSRRGEGGECGAIVTKSQRRQLLTVVLRSKQLQRVRVPDGHSVDYGIGIRYEKALGLLFRVNCLACVNT